MVLGYVFLNSLGAIVLKMQIEKLEAPLLSYASSYISFFYSLVSSWKTWVGLASIFAATGAWMIALSIFELSRIYPIAISLNLLIVTAFSIGFYHERLSTLKLFGIIVIMLGVVILFWKGGGD